MSTATGVLNFGNPQTRTAYTRYVMGLEAAYRWRDWVNDPSFVLAEDVDLYNKVRRDPVFEHAMMFRRQLAAGREWTVEPASRDDRDRLLTRCLEHGLRELRGFTDARVRLANAIFLGSAYERVEGERRRLTIDGAPDMVWWVPTRMRHVDRRRWRLYHDPCTAVDGNDATRRALELAAMKGDSDAARRLKNAAARVINAPAWQFYSIERSDWEYVTDEEFGWFQRLAFDQTEDTLGYGRGLLESLFFYAAAKTDLLRSGLEAAERFGQGMLMVAIDALMQDGAGPNDDTRTRAENYRRELAKTRKDGIFTYHKGDEPKALNGLGEGWELIQALIAYIDNQIRTLVLGSNLTSSATAGGSYALAAAQENSQEALVQGNRESVSEALDDGVCRLWVRQNAANLRMLGLEGARHGKFALVHERTASDPAAFAQTVTVLRQAGVPVRLRDVYQRTGLTEPMPGDAVLGPITAQPGDPPADATLEGPAALSRASAGLDGPPPASVPPVSGSA